MKLSLRTGVIAALAFGSLLLLGACNEYSDSSYDASFNVRGKYWIQYSHSVDIEQTADGVVRIYSRNRGQDASNVKISGTGDFAVYGCGSLKITQGAHVEAHDCNTVSALPSTSVVTYNVGTLYAAPGVEYDVHATTYVYHPEPTADKGVSANDMPEVGTAPNIPPKQ